MLADLALALVLAPLTALVIGTPFWLLLRSRDPVAATAEGWIEMRRSLFDHGVAWMTVTGPVVLLIFVVGSIISGEYLSDDEFLRNILLCVISCISVPYMFFEFYLPMIRFNSGMIEYGSLRERISVPWAEVNKIDVGLNGPTVVTSRGHFSISRSRRGFDQLLETARAQGVDVRNSRFLWR